MRWRRDRNNEAAERRLPDAAAFVLSLASVFVILAFLAYFVFVASTPGLRDKVKGDFPQWIVGARLLREAPDRLYDLDSQLRQYGAAAGAKPAYPYLYPPFIAALFVPIATAPFLISFLLWAVLSAILYGCAVVLLAPLHQRFAAISLALASPLFLWYTLVYGQLSSLACAALAGAIFLERRGRRLLGGAALGFCVYKPTLLLWIVPMLLFRRQFRALLGIAGTGIVLAAISLAAAGRHASLDWLRTLFRWTDRITIGGGHYPLSKFVDLNASVKLVAFEPKALVAIIAVLMAAAAVAATVRTWRGPLEVCWAATLGLTLLVNVYAPIYDATLLVLAILASWSPQNGRACAIFLVAAHLAGWWSEDLARRGWPPLVMLVVFAFVLYQWRSASSVTRPARAAAAGQAG